MTVDLWYLETSYLDLSSKPVLHTAVLSFCVYIMYSIQHLKESSKTTMNVQEKTNHILCGEDHALSVKVQKDNMFQSIINFLTCFGESFLRTSILSLSKRNHSLSVTIVNHEDKINTEIIKCLLDKEKSLNINTAYAFNIQREKPPITTEKAMYDVPFRYHKNEDIIKMNDENINIVQNLRSSINSDIIYKNSGATIFQSQPHVHITEMSRDITDNSCKTETDLQKCIDNDKDILNNKKTFIHSYAYNEEDTSVETESFTVVHDLDIPLHFLNSAKEISMSTCISDMCRKIWNNVTDRFSPNKMESIYYEESIKCSKSKQQKRDNTIAMYRDRDIGKSWLKRSRVMQSKHQKERTKNDLAMDIQDDYETWQDIQNASLLDNSSLDEKEYEFLNIAELIKKDDSGLSKFSHNISKEQKPKTSKVMKQEKLKYSTRVRYTPEHSLERNYDDYNNRTGCDLQNNHFRSRLMSESSTDSEDSYCITFESGSEIDCIPNIDYEETSTEDSEDDEDMEEITKHKVKFNMNPVVHTMIHWDYAYRAARKGPWEEIARDRERFKGRIHSMSIVLSPILAAEHRTRIWEERYAVDK